VGWKLPALWAVLVVIALTLAGVVIGQVVGGLTGALAGAVPGALAAVVAGFVPELRDAEHRRRDELARQQLEESAALEEARTEWDAVGVPAADAAGRGHAALLRPEREIVEFAGREAELDALQPWCDGEAGRSVRIIIGAGGVGKTRLALRIASGWEGPGREWKLVDAGQESRALAAARRVTSGPVLLVVDYAETRADLGPMLRAVLADPGPLRLLLVARNLGEWWHRLIEESPPAVGWLLTEAEPIKLAEPISKDISDADLAAAAVPYFAGKLGVPAPDRVEFDLPPHRAPVLVLHAAALIAVLRSTGPSASPRPVVVADVLDEMLVHEARYWRLAATAARLPGDGPMLKPLTAAAALLGAGTLAEAAELVARVPELAGSPELRWSWARWLYGLYPAGTDGRLGSLQPDVLAEKHVVSQLAGDPGLARGCLRDLSAGQAERALTVLARAWAYQADARQLIADALHDDLGGLALPAAQVALRTRGSVGGLLARALRDAPAQLETLIGVAEALPFPSATLAEACLEATCRIQRSLPPDAGPATVALWSERAGTLLSQLGHPEQAFQLMKDAVAAYRELARISPELYRPDLARSLSSLGLAYSVLGSPSDALAAEQEALVIRRELAQIDPGRHRCGVAYSLTWLGVILGIEQGRPEQGLTATEEAVVIYRELGGLEPGCYRPELAESLTNLGELLSRLDRPQQALSATEEAVAIYRALARLNPDRYRPGLACCLVNLGIRLAQLGLPGQARPLMEEAVATQRELVQLNPDRYRRDLAKSVANLKTVTLQLQQIPQ
jgi:tetratricopeptide (TPR) repeat protein